MRWMVLFLFFMGSSYLFATAKSGWELIQSMATFLISFALAFLLMKSDMPFAKKILDRF